MPQLIWWWLATSIVITAIQPAVIGILPLERGIYHAKKRIARPPIWQDLSQVGGDGHQNNYHWFSNQPNNIDWIQFLLITANQHRINSTIIPKIQRFIIMYHWNCQTASVSHFHTHPNGRVWKHWMLASINKIKSSTCLPTKTTNQEKSECFLMEEATAMWIWMVSQVRRIQ